MRCAMSAHRFRRSAAAPEAAREERRRQHEARAASCGGGAAADVGAPDAAGSGVATRADAFGSRRPRASCSARSRCSSAGAESVHLVLRWSGGDGVRAWETHAVLSETASLSARRFDSATPRAFERRGEREPPVAAPSADGAAAARSALRLEERGGRRTP